MWRSLSTGLTELQSQSACTPPYEMFQMTLHRHEAEHASDPFSVVLQHFQGRQWESLSEGEADITPLTRS